MRTKQRLLSLMLVPGAMAASSMVAGCASHSGYAETGADVRVYDVDHSDYHVWNNNEVTVYSKWENDTHRDHVEYNKRNASEQKEYWTYRHSHS